MLDFLLRVLLTFGVILLSYHLYPIILGFTQEVADFQGKLFGLMPLEWLDTQFFQGMVFLFLCVWFWAYANGFVEELKIAHFKTLNAVVRCTCRWLIAMLLWALLILGEPVLVYMALGESNLPYWLQCLVVVFFFLFSIGFGLEYPARTILHLRDTYGLPGNDP